MATKLNALLLYQVYPAGARIGGNKGEQIRHVHLSMDTHVQRRAGMQAEVRIRGGGVKWSTCLGLRNFTDSDL